MQILVLGTGCAKCVQTEKIVREAVKRCESKAQVTKVSDMMEIVRHGVMSTPAVIIDGKIVCSGRVPTVEQVQSWIDGNSHEIDSNPCTCGGCGCSR